MNLFRRPVDVKKMIETGKRLSDIFNQFTMESFIGKTTKEIDLKVAELLEKNKLTSQAYGYHGFPGYSCISINDELVHGVPNNEKIVTEKDLLKLDICAKHDGYCADMARMYAFFENNETYKKLLECGEKSIQVALENMKLGNRIGDISSAVEKTILDHKFSVVTDFTGHGIGKSMHEDPAVPNFGFAKTGERILIGMALAIEPMYCEFGSDIIISKKDKWTAITKDNGLAAHIEDTFVLDENGPIIVTR